MKAVEFPESNVKYVAPGCGDLPAFVDGTQIISCWELSEAEREIVLATGKIWLTIVGNIQPPINLRADMPFVEKTPWPDEITKEK